MKKIILLVVSILFVFVLQCSKGNADENKYTCQTDVDCTNSCSQGAVNKQWYQTQFDQKTECRDGCNGASSSPPRCIDSICTAFWFGQYHAACMKGPEPKTSVLKSLTQHSCDSHADCILSCEHGAVNKHWYEQAKLKKAFIECDDGCAADGFDSKCENHICEAYFEGKKYPGCTRK